MTTKEFKRNSTLFLLRLSDLGVTNVREKKKKDFEVALVGKYAEVDVKIDIYNPAPERTIMLVWMLVENSFNPFIEGIIQDNGDADIKVDISSVLRGNFETS